MTEQTYETDTVNRYIPLSEAAKVFQLLNELHDQIKKKPLSELPYYELEDEVCIDDVDTIKSYMKAHPDFFIDAPLFINRATLLLIYNDLEKVQRTVSFVNFFNTDNDDKEKQFFDNMRKLLMFEYFPIKYLVQSLQASGLNNLAIDNGLLEYEADKSTANETDKDMQSYKIACESGFLKPKYAAYHLGMSKDNLDKKRIADKQRITRESIPYVGKGKSILYPVDALDAFKIQDWELLKEL